MSSFTTAKTDLQNRAQRRLLFEGFTIHDNKTSSQHHQSLTMLTSTPDRKLHEKENEHLDIIPSNELQLSEPCLLQLQNARQLLHSMSRSSIQPTNEQPLIDDQQSRSELSNETNPELLYYKSSLESERSRRKQLETLIDVQQKRLTEAESELIQLRANDHKKTLCMKQLEQMIPNVVDEWKQKEADYKTKLNNASQQIKQIEQTNREKMCSERQQFDTQLNEKKSLIERLMKDNETVKNDYENIQSKAKQYEQRIQQLTKDSEEAKQRWSALETDLRNEIKNGETRFNDIQSELDKKQELIEQTLHDQQKVNNDYQAKIRQLENELDEQRRESNVLKMELELHEAKYKAQTESLKIQLMRDAETKLSQRLEEQHAKHLQIEEELNELHCRKLSDLEGKHEQILSNERHEHENRVQTLLSKLDQMKNEIEHIQSTTNAERQDLVKKLQDVFETALFKGSTKINLSQNETNNLPSSSTQFSQIKPQLNHIQANPQSHELVPVLPLTSSNHPANMSVICSLSSRIDSLVNETNRVASGFELNSHLPVSSQQGKTSQWVDENPNHLISSQSQSAIHSPFFRSTPIDSLQEWYPQTNIRSSVHLNNNQSTHRSHSADPTSSGLFSIYPSYNHKQQHSSTSFNLDNNSNLGYFHQLEIPSYHSTTSISSDLIDHHQEVKATISKDSIENRQNDQISSTNESLTRYVKILLERSPTQNNNTSTKHPLAKTNQSLDDIELSIQRLNLAERDSKLIIDDLVFNDESQTSHLLTPRQNKTSKMNHGGDRAKKRLNYDTHNNKQSNTNELFERLSQPKTRLKRDKLKQQHQASSGGHGAWK